MRRLFLEELEVFWHVTGSGFTAPLTLTTFFLVSEMCGIYDVQYSLQKIVIFLLLHLQARTMSCVTFMSDICDT